jgi:alpha-L-fucosidase
MRFDSDVKDPRFSGLYGPARSRELAEEQKEPPDKAFRDDWLRGIVREFMEKYSV